MKKKKKDSKTKGKRWQRSRHTRGKVQDIKTVNTKVKEKYLIALVGFQINRYTLKPTGVKIMAFAWVLLV